MVLWTNGGNFFVDGGPFKQRRWSGFYSSFRVPFCQYLMEKDVPFPAELLQGFEGAMDEPFHLLYEEVLRAYPDAKFVYTLADPDTWYASYINFYDHLPHGHPSGTLSNL